MKQILIIIVGLLALMTTHASERQKLLFNDGWQLHIGDIASPMGGGLEGAGAGGNESGDDGSQSCNYDLKGLALDNWPNLFPEPFRKVHSNRFFTLKRPLQKQSKTKKNKEKPESF